ncbi:MAG TPA: metal-dependent hydrolase [Firmicutes bacterium]|nr:metal-dependent hydrolase [Bacillota bacterium]
MRETLTWLGQAATRLVSATGSHLFFDPWVTGNPVCPVKLEDLGRVDVILVTHGHFDHFGDSLAICRRTGAKLVGSPEVAWYADQKGIARGSQALPMGIGGTIQVGGFIIHMVPALHQTALYGEEWQAERRFIPDGGAAGYVVRTPGGVNVYHAGDTALFSDMRLIAERFSLDVALLPIGGRFTMDPFDAARAVELLRPRVVIPIHYNTNPDLTVDVSEFVQGVKARSPRTEVVVLKPGESVEL